MTYEADLRNSSASLALMRDAIRSAKMQSEALNASYLSDQKRFQEHLDGLTDQMRDKTLTLEQIGKNLPTLEAKHDALKNEVSELGRLKSDLEDFLKQKEEAERKASQLGETIDALTSRREALRSELSDLNKLRERAAAEKQAADIAQGVAEQNLVHAESQLSGKMKALGDVSKQIEEQQKKLNELSSKVATLEARRKELTAAQETVSNLANEIARLQEEKKGT